MEPIALLTNLSISATHELKILSRKFIICIRVFIAAHLLLNWGAMILNLCLVLSNAAELFGVDFVVLGQSFVPLAALLAAAAHGGIGE